MNDKTRILITGDFYPGERLLELISANNQEVVFNDFLPFIKESHLAITNLECPLIEDGHKIKKTGPHLKAGTNVSKFLLEAGFKLVTLANNHIMDYGDDGLFSTMRACDNIDLGYVGVGVDCSQSRRAKTITLNNFRVSILNFTENEFSTTNGSYPGANPVDPVKNYKDISSAKAYSDFVIVIYHGGHEMYPLPSPALKELFHFYADAGASVIVSHHTHCYSGYERYKAVPIFYGLGNFLFDKVNAIKTNWNYGFAVLLSLENQVDFEIIPYEQCSDTPGVKLLDEIEILNFNRNIERLNSLIIDDERLMEMFVAHCIKMRKAYLSYLEPISNRVLNHFQNKRLFPRILSKKKRTLLLNLMKCESHREMLINILSIELSEK